MKGEKPRKKSKKRKIRSEKGRNSGPPTRQVKNDQKGKKKLYGVAK